MKLALKILATKLTSPEAGISTRTIKKKKGIYSNCFNGEDLVKWICSTLKLSKEKALPIANSMHTSGILQKIGEIKPVFKETFIYRVAAQV